MNGNNLQDKFRTDLICQTCGHHTTHKKITKQGKDRYFCIECGSEYQEVKDANTKRDNR